MAKQTSSDLTSVNIIASGTQITGDIQTDTDIRIDGRLNGNLKTKGRVIIGQGGQVHGEISCRNAEIEGFIEGSINTSEQLSLKATSRLSGEITVGQLMIEPGAVFTGQCKMQVPENNKSK